MVGEAASTSHQRLVPAPTAQPANSPESAPFFRLRMCCFIIEEAPFFLFFFIPFT